MGAAFGRLTDIQQKCVNREMFNTAYSCVARSRGDPDALAEMVQETTRNCPHLEADLVRYCKLVQGVM